MLDTFIAPPLTTGEKGHECPSDWPATQGVFDRLDILVRRTTVDLRFHHNFVDSLTVRENFSVKVILMRKSVRVLVGELGCR